MSWFKKEPEKPSSYVLYYSPGCKYHPGYKDRSIPYYHRVIWSKWESWTSRWDADQAMQFHSEESALEYAKEHNIKWPLIARTRSI